MVYFTKIANITDSAKCKGKNLFSNNCFYGELFAISAINVTKNRFLNILWRRE